MKKIRRAESSLKFKGQTCQEAAGPGGESLQTYFSLFRIETGRSRPQPGNVRTLLELYGVTGPERDGLIQLIRDARKPGWWHSFRDVLPNPYEVYIGLEAGAASIRRTSGGSGWWADSGFAGKLSSMDDAHRLRLHRWNDRAVVGVAVAAFASGFGQFGVVAALGDVARGFGQVNHGATLADQAGLSGTDLGIGLAIMRLASLGALPVTGLADRFGRRMLLLVTVGAGLAMTALAAASPSYWWFVAIFACGRPLLSATNGLAQVTAAEQTASTDRAKAVALIAAGYGTGAGAIAIVHSLAASTLGFRGVFVLALVPLALLPLLWRWIAEPDRFTVAAAGSGHPIPVLDAVARPFRGRLAVIAVLAFAVSVITGPANSFVFLFAQNVLHQPGVVTAGMVAGAGVAGLAGLLAGRWLADRIGRRLTGALAMVTVALFATLTYTGSAPALLAGYILGVFAASVFAPAAGSLVNELFPTPVRASVAGWSLAAGVLGAVTGLVAFGAVAGSGHRFAVAGLVTFVPPALIMVLFWLLPETRGREPEDLWPTT